MSNSSIWPIDRTLPSAHHFGSESTWEWWQWRGTPYSPELQHYWSLMIRLFSVISRTLIEGSHPSAEMHLVYSTAPDDLVTLLFAHSWKENIWIRTFPKSISTMWNVNSLIGDLNSGHQVHFLWAGLTYRKFISSTDKNQGE